MHVIHDTRSVTLRYGTIRAVAKKSARDCKLEFYIVRNGNLTPFTTYVWLTDDEWIEVMTMVESLMGIST